MLEGGSGRAKVCSERDGFCCLAEWSAEFGQDVFALGAFSGDHYRDGSVLGRFNMQMCSGRRFLPLITLYCRYCSDEVRPAELNLELPTGLADRLRIPLDLGRRLHRAAPCRHIQTGGCSLPGGSIQGSNTNIKSLVGFGRLALPRHFYLGYSLDVDV